MSENGEIYSAGKNFTLPPALTTWTNSTSEVELLSKMLDGWMGEWSGYPIDCYDYWSTCGAKSIAYI